MNKRCCIILLIVFLVLVVAVALIVLGALAWVRAVKTPDIVNADNLTVFVTTTICLTVMVCCSVICLTVLCAYCLKAIFKLTATNTDNSCNEILYDAYKDVFRKKSSPRSKQDENKS